MFFFFLDTQIFYYNLEFFLENICRWHSMSIFVRKCLYICFILKGIFTGYNDPDWQLLLSQYIDTVIFLSSDIHCDEEKYYVILLALLRWNFSLLVYTIYVISLIFFNITVMQISFHLSCLWFFVWVFGFLESFIISFISHSWVLHCLRNLHLNIFLKHSFISSQNFSQCKELI